MTPEPDGSKERTMSEQLHCPRCGHEIDREHPVCPGCGVKLRFRPLNLPKPTDEPVIKIPKAVADKIEPTPAPRVPRSPVQSGEDKTVPSPPTAETSRKKEFPGERAPDGFGGAWGRGWKFSFEGRASRKEYWLRQISFALEGAVVLVAAGILRSTLDSDLPLLLVLAWLLAILVPGWALFARRLHDVGFSGYLAIGRPVAVGLDIAWVAIPILYELEVISFDAALWAEPISTWAVVVSCVQFALEAIFGMFPGVPGANKHGANPYGIKGTPSDRMQAICSNLAEQSRRLGTVAGANIAKLPGLFNRYLVPAGTCEGCGAKLPHGKKFCPRCGRPVPEAKPCRKCGGKVAPGEKFCPQCGTPVFETCRGCGGKLDPGQEFCPQCGMPVSTVPEKVACRKCGAELDAGQKFCPKCGSPVEGALKEEQPAPRETLESPAQEE